MIRTLSNSLLAVSLIALAAVTSSPLVAAEKATTKPAAKVDVTKAEAEKATEKTAEKTTEKPVEPAAPAAPVAPETPAAAAPAAAATAEKLPSSYKAGNLEISNVSVSEKGGAFEIYLTIKNNGKADDAITSAELTEGTGEIVTISKVTTKEISNQEAIKKAQEEATKAMQVAATPPKEGEKAEPPKRVEPPKPEYKDVTKEVEGGMITLLADKTTKLESGEAHLKLTGYKKVAKQGDAMSIMLHFRSSPNVTVKAKAGGAGGSLINKLFGN